MTATMMPKSEPTTAALSRRESQVMDILHRRSGATVAEIMADLPDPPTYSAVRSVLRILSEKELITTCTRSTSGWTRRWLINERAQAEPLAPVIPTTYRLTVPSSRGI